MSKNDLFDNKYGYLPHLNHMELYQCMKVDCSTNNHIKKNPKTKWGYDMHDFQMSKFQGSDLKLLELKKLLLLLFQKI